MTNPLFCNMYFANAFFSQGTRRHKIVTHLRSSVFRDVMKNFLIRPLEVRTPFLDNIKLLARQYWPFVQAFNTAWLTYIIFAQTFGGYEVSFYETQFITHANELGLDMQLQGLDLGS